MRLFLFALIISSSFLCAGCARETNDSDTDSTPLTVWYLNNTTGLEAAIVRAASELSATETIAPVSYKACTVLELKLLAEGHHVIDNPDVIIVPSEYLAMLASSNVLQRAVQPSEVEIPVAMQSCVWQGASWATPLACDTRMLFINKDLFRTDSLTPLLISSTNILTYSSAFTGPSGGFWAAQNDDPEMMYRTILSWISMFGAEVFDQNSNPVLSSIQNVRALESFADLAHEGTTETERYLDGAFRHGSIGFWYGRASLTRDLHQRSSNNWLMRQLHSENHAPIVFTTVACVSRTTTNARLASRFITALKKSIEVHSVAGFPTTRAYWTSSSKTGSYDMTLTFQSMMKGRCIPSHPQWDEICPILESAYTRVILGLAEPEQSLQKAQNELIQLRAS